MRGMILARALLLSRCRNDWWVKMQNMFSRYILVLALVGVSGVGAQSVAPSSEIPVELFKDRTRSIYPGLMLYGLEWMSSEAETRNAFGAPTAVLAVSPHSRAYYYGKSHVLIFEDDELREVIISHASNFHSLRDRIREHPFFDPDKTRLEPGLKFLMRLDDAQKVLKGEIDQLSADHPWQTEATYLENYAVITLKFARSLDPSHLKPGEEFTNVLMSIGIRMQ